MTAPHHDDGDRPLPGLIASPALAELLAHLEAADRCHARATALLAEFHRSGQVEEVTGVAVETWLLAHGLPRTDRRMLATAATQLSRLPAVRDGFDRGLLSWGQVRTICLLTEPLSTDDAARFDLDLAPTIGRYVDADPDSLLTVARQLIDRLRATDVADEVVAVERSSFLAFQPRLDGTGAKVHGDLDGLGYGLVAAALDRHAPLPGRRHELIGQDPASAGGYGRWSGGDGLGKHRADRLVQLCADDLARHGTPLTPRVALAADAPEREPATAGVDATAAHGRGSAAGRDGQAADGVDRTRALAPEALLVLTEAQLTGEDGLPVELITKLTGGRLKVAAPTATRWLEVAGARLRTIVLDPTGQVLGVGRTTRIPPGWIRDARLATDATCRAPGCRTAAAACDLDHHTPVHAHRPGDTPGRTDLDNLGPLCRTDNRTKDVQGWQITTNPDGTTTWNHPRSGIHLRTIPHTTTAAAAAASSAAAASGSGATPPVDTGPSPGTDPPAANDPPTNSDPSPGTGPPPDTDPPPDPDPPGATSPHPF